ncbi:SDR family oxidoreductase [Nocardioides immobilis]|uniref:SDR family oxidoreductase n=1 Tax=Nocardioides immobilis TaxID=2049295 RepID=A0A417Y8X5_9ACTN|nr:SDR family oxidoreductase [Nocardioides immobilis]RHW29173.1 SDR family oxidoreductase [Nocardioides immobilis]
MTDERPISLVTGAAGGLGRVISGALMRDGHRLVALDVAERPLAELTSNLTSQGYDPSDVMTVLADLRDETAIAAAVAAVGERWGRLDHVVHNAGIEPPHKASSVTVEIWDETFAINTRAGALLVKHTAPFWEAQQGGTFIAIGSRTWLSGSSTGAYGASKAALVGLMRSIAVELGPIGVRANVVAPGFVRSPLNASKGDSAYVEEYAREFSDLAPLRRLIEPIDVAEAVAFLVSPGARNITGDVINVAGGMHIPPTVRWPKTRRHGLTDR